MPAPLSIIIPTLDAEEHLPGCLASLIPGLESGLIREVIIVDGGSNDRTKALADSAGARIFDSPHGRGPQLASGASQARGIWYLFLHADTILSEDWVSACQHHMDKRPSHAAAFQLAYRSTARAGRSLANRTNLRAKYLSLPYGDQGLLISRGLYNDVGGYPPLRLFEDVSIVRQIGRKRIDILPAIAETSAEKYEQEGWHRRSWRNFWLIARYFMGADPEKLALEYDRSLTDAAARPKRTPSPQSPL